MLAVIEIFCIWNSVVQHETNLVYGSQYGLILMELFQGICQLSVSIRGKFETNLCFLH